MFYHNEKIRLFLILYNFFYSIKSGFFYVFAVIIYHKIVFSFVYVVINKVYKTIFLITMLL